MILLGLPEALAGVLLPHRLVDTTLNMAPTGRIMNGMMRIMTGKKTNGMKNRKMMKIMIMIGMMRDGMKMMKKILMA